MIVRPTRMRLMALRDSIERGLVALRFGDLKSTESHAVDAHTRICALLPTPAEVEAKKQRARVAGKLGGTMKAKNKLLRAGASGSKEKENGR